MLFASRHDAGQKLGLRLSNEGVEVDVVVGLPRGGVIVAAEVAQILQRPLETLVVRKIGHPLQREFAVGALAEGNVVLLDDETIGRNAVVRSKLAEIIKEEKERLWQYQLKFHQGAKFDFRDKSVLLVDDGLATGSTMEAALLSAREQRARETIVAVPVASTNAMDRLRKTGCEVSALLVDREFEAVGAYYDSFPQTTDEEVQSLLNTMHTHS